MVPTATVSNALHRDRVKLGCLPGHTVRKVRFERCVDEVFGERPRVEIPIPVEYVESVSNAAVVHIIHVDPAVDRTRIDRQRAERIDWGNVVTADAEPRLQAQLVTEHVAKMHVTQEAADPAAQCAVRGGSRGVAHRPRPDADAIRSKRPKRHAPSRRQATEILLTLAQWRKRAPSDRPRCSNAESRVPESLRQSSALVRRRRQHCSRL